MANKARIGLAHFPLGTDFFDDKKVQRLVIYYGGNGTGSERAFSP